MAQTLRFSEVLEAVGQLSPDEQDTLIEILRRRLAEEGRKRVIRDIHEARQEFSSGSCKSVSVDELMGEILC